MRKTFAQGEDTPVFPRPDLRLDDSTLEHQLKRWIALVVEQDQDALACLYDALVGRVYGIALRVTGSGVTAEEVTEDTFFQVWRQAPRFRSERGTALGWVMTIARSRALDARRSAERLDAHWSDQDPILMAHASSDLLADLVKTEFSERVMDALATLEPEPRQLLALAFWHGLTHEEIAKRCDLPLGTVKSHIRRALQRLKPLLAINEE